MCILYVCMQGKKKGGVQSQHTVWQWQEFMDFHIAGNGLCELLAEVALRHTDESCRAYAKEITDWLANEDLSYSETCRVRVAAAFEQLSSSESSSTPSSFVSALTEW